MIFGRPPSPLPGRFLPRRGARPGPPSARRAANPPPARRDPGRPGIRPGRSGRSAPSSSARAAPPLLDGFRRYRDRSRIGRISPHHGVPWRGEPDMLRRCTADDFDRILAIINDAAMAYRGIIPDDRWKEPYMPAEELAEEIAAGIEFDGYEIAGDRAGGRDGRPDGRGRGAHPPRLRGDGPSTGGGRVGAARGTARAGWTARFLIGTWAARDLGDRLLPAARLRAGPGGGEVGPYCGATGPFRSARSRPRWCWRTPGGTFGRRAGPPPRRRFPMQAHEVTRHHHRGVRPHGGSLPQGAPRTTT